MNFVAQVEEHLRDLGAEARKKHPGVKEASERAILQLRTLQNSYVTAVRKASASPDVEHPTTAIFQSQDLLRPFLLGANYPNASASLLEISLSGMSLLIRNDAISPGDGVHMVRVLTIQANVCSATLRTKSKSPDATSQSGTMSSSGWFGSMLSTSTPETSSSGSNSRKDSYEKLALGLLRCLILLLEHENDSQGNTTISEEEWTASVNLCCILADVSVPVVLQAAKSSLHQVLSMLFGHTSPIPSHSVATWKDLLKLATAKTAVSHSDLTGAFAGCAKLPSPTFTLEVMTRILEGNLKWFKVTNENIVSDTVSSAASLLRELTAKKSTNFELIWRSYQLANSVLCIDHLEMESFIELQNELKLSVVRATEACRLHHDFEDGFVYDAEVILIQSKKALKVAPTLIPDSVLWKAGLALEILVAFLSEEKELSLDSSVCEAISDFATIAASCRDHMIQLVEVRRSKSTRPSLFRKAEEIQMAAVQQRMEGQMIPSPSNASSSMGQALWLSLDCIICFSNLHDDSMFTSCLAVLQHYLKRFPFSTEIVETALDGYTNLARKVLVPFKSGSAKMQERILLASLCKLSLPSWGTHDSAVQLEDHHAKTLLCLLKMIHVHFDDIGEDWNVVLRTLQELSGLTVSSEKLSERGKHDALLIMEAFSRFAALSACLEDTSLRDMLSGLTEVVGTLEFATVDGIEPDRRRLNGSGSNPEAPSMGGRLIGIAGRALTSSVNHGDSKEADSSQRNKRRTASSRRQFSAEYHVDFLQRLSSSRISSSAKGLGGKLPFSLMLLTDIALVNGFRYETVGASISEHFCSIASNSAEFRPFCMEILFLLITFDIAGEASIPATFHGRGRLIAKNPSASELLVVVASPSDAEQNGSVVRTSELVLTKPFCSALANTNSSDFAESGIGALRSILENSGHDIDQRVWVHVIQAISSLSGDGQRKGTEWASASIIAFSCLRLVVDDFFDRLPVSGVNESNSPHRSLLECCGAFGSSRHDVNTSLTAINLLWKIADHDSKSTSLGRALSRLVLLSADSRTEVRNCAVNTLFSCIVGKGQTFTEDEWEKCFTETIFAAHDKVLHCRLLSENEERIEANEGSRYKTNIHHSRDSERKLWFTTEVLLLRGLDKVLRMFYSPTLVNTMETMKVEIGKSLTGNDRPWFLLIWSRILLSGFNAAKEQGGRETLDLRIAGVDLLVLCCQLSCRAGIHAALSPARVGTNMEVVNGALRSVRDATSRGANGADDHHSFSELVRRRREQQFADAFQKLDDFRSHLENDEVEEIQPSYYVGTVKLQVLQRLVSGLTKLYDCCRHEELSPAVDASVVLPGDVEWSNGIQENGGSGYEARFVLLTCLIIKSAVSDQGTRFLTQAQREAVDLLRSMINDFSSEALKALAAMAGQAFFWIFVQDEEQEENHDENDYESTPLGNRALEREAAIVVSTEICKEHIAPKTQLLVLCRLLSVFLVGVDGQDRKRRRDYRLAVPIVEAGLSSATKLQDDRRFQPIIEPVWEKLLDTLLAMLEPVHTDQSAHLAQPKTLAKLMNASSRNAIEEFREGLVEVLLRGVATSLDVLRNIQQPCSDVDQRRKENALTVYRSSLSGLCLLTPDSLVFRRVLRANLRRVLNSDISDDTDIQVAISSLQAVKESSDTEGLSIAIFPDICKLLSVENTSLRSLIGEIMEQVNVGDAIADATARAETAQARVEELENENEELMIAIDELREENDRLQRDIAVFSTSSALT